MKFSDFFKNKQKNIFKFPSMNLVNKDLKKGHHPHKNKTNQQKIIDNYLEEGQGEQDLPNIYTTIKKENFNSDDEAIKVYSNISPRKIHGNMTGMDKINEFTQFSDVNKDILKDESKSTKTSTNVEFTFRGNLNTEDSPPPKEDITDVPKKIN
jgi:hypothetical protein